MHGVQPGNVVGAIANEVGIDGKHIGRVVIRDDRSLVDLPAGHGLQSTVDAAQEFLLLDVRLGTARSAGREDTLRTSLSKAGIYIDTIAIADPFLRAQAATRRWVQFEKSFHTSRAALRLLHYRTLACADLPAPILAVIPGFAETDAKDKQFCHQLGKLTL